MLKTLHAWRAVFSFYLLFYLSLHFLFGIAYALEEKMYFLVLSICLAFLFYKNRFSLLFGGLLFFCCGFFVAKAQCRPFPFENKIEGKAIFTIHSLRKAPHPILRLWSIKGTITHFSNDDFEESYSFPFYAITKERPHLKIGHCYTETLTLENQSSYTLYARSFPPSPHDLGILDPWLKWRAQRKENIKRLIHRHFSSLHVRSLLTGLATGNLEDPLLSFYFQKLGLQHLLAISGFHFGIVALFAHFFLNRFLGLRLKALVLIGILSLYFIYLGDAPSVFRAFIASLFAAGASALKAKVKTINVLSCSLMMDLSFHPLNFYSLGFSLSYAATLGILTLYDSFLEKLKKALFLPSSLISLLALQLSASLLTFPILLYSFHTIPLLSFIYNLFIPFGITLIMILLIIWLPFVGIPYLGNYLTIAIEWLTQALLQILFYYPRSWEFSWSCPSFSKEILLMLLCLVIGYAIFLLEKTLLIDKMLPYLWRK